MKSFIFYLEGVLLLGLGISIVCSEWWLLLLVAFFGFLVAIMVKDGNDACCGY